MNTECYIVYVNLSKKVVPDVVFIAMKTTSRNMIKKQLHLNLFLENGSSRWRFVQTQKNFIA